MVILEAALLYILYKFFGAVFSSDSFVPRTPAEAQKQAEYMKMAAEYLKQQEADKENEKDSEKNLDEFLDEKNLSEEEKKDIYYYLAIRSYILKLRAKGGTVSTEEMSEYVSNLLADAIKGDEVKVLTQGKDDSINVIELLSPEKIEELRKKNPPLIFVEIVKKLLERAIAESRKNNFFKSQEYSKRLRKILEKYNDRDASFAPESTIVDLVNFASEMVSDENEASALGITGRERAFYDALVRDKSAQELLNDETLKLIATELKDIVEEYAKTDWANKESTRARMRTKIKQCLTKYNYPPEFKIQAVEDVIKQAEYIMNDQLAFWSFL